MRSQHSRMDIDIPAKINRLENDLDKTTDAAERVAIRQQLTEYIKLLQQITPKPGIFTFRYHFMLDLLT